METKAGEEKKIEWMQGIGGWWVGWGGGWLAKGKRKSREEWGK